MADKRGRGEVLKTRGKRGGGRRRLRGGGTGGRGTGGRGTGGVERDEFTIVDHLF